jgi:radical SAM protein with 4Fe4S-binding SPASM domain
VRLARASEGAGGVLLRSDLVAVPSGREVVLAFVASGSGAAPTVRVVAPDETVVAERPIAFASNGPARETRLAIATGPYRALRIEIADTGAPHATTIGLGRVRRPAPILLSNQPLSRAARWEAGVEGASVHWTDCVQEVRWQGPEFLYLAKSYSQPCLPDTTLVYPARIVVGRGRLGIGVLSEDFSHFIATFAFDAGAHEALLAFPSGANRRFQIVLYAIGSDGVEARVDWSRAMTEVPSPELARPLVPALEVRETGPDRVRSRELRPAPLGAAVAEVAGPPGAAEGRSSGLGRRLREFLMGPPRMYCHKPWTDLHNFTVDGRMDVCCIATGPSQKRYELGNLTTQRFQEVWNGPVAREFRRTVNDPVKALPPCQRCPMARAYQGPYFDPEGTAWQFWALVRLRGLWGVPGFKWLHRMLFAALYGPLHILLFRGFKRADLFPSKALKSWYVER